MLASICRPFDALPAVDQIRDALRTHLPVRIPLERGVLPTSAPLYVRNSLATQCVDYKAHILQNLVEPLVIPGCESVWSCPGSDNANQYLWDTLITKVYHAFMDTSLNVGVRMEYDRNTRTATADTTVMDFRPDFLWMFQDVLLFRGEERPTEREFSQAINDNNRKIHWHMLIYGARLPYVLTYAAAGRRICFYVVRRGSNQSEPVTNVFNVANPSDRLEVVLCVINIMRLCLTLAPLCPVMPLCVGHRLTTATRTVTFSETFVLKVVNMNVTANLTAVDTLKELYADIKTHNVLFTTRAERITVKRGNELHLRITPLALQVKPQSEAELKACVLCLLQALEGLHALGWVHRDIRWPNVLKTESAWILSDFENSDRVNSQVRWVNEALPLEVRNGAPYLRSADMYQIGHLLEDFEVDRFIQSPVARAFSDKCLDAEPTRRPTAERALQDPWLLADSVPSSTL